MGALLGIVVIIVGVVNAISPQTGWNMSEGWKFKNAEPSEGALEIIRIGGIVCILFGLAMVFGN